MSQYAIEEIHESLVNGQRKQMTRQIDEYGLYDFWADYRDFLEEIAASGDDLLFKLHYTDAVISYHRIKNQ